MAALTTVGVTAIISFNGISQGMTENYDRYKTQSRAPHAFLSTGLVNYESNNVIKDIEALKEVDEAESSIYLPCSTYLPETKERKAGTKSTQLFTFDKDYDKYQPTFHETARYKKNITNVYVEKSFANLNKIHANQTLMIGYYEQYIKVNVCGVIAYPDTVVYGASNAVSSENNNFGRIYVEKHQISWLYNDLVKLLEDQIKTLPVSGNDLGLWDAESGVAVSAEKLVGLGTTYEFQPGDFFRTINAGNKLPKDVYDINSDENYVIGDDVEPLESVQFNGTGWDVAPIADSQLLLTVANFLDNAVKFKGFISDQSQEYANRLTVYFKDGVNQRETLAAVKDILKDKHIKVNESYIFDDSLSASIIQSSSSAIKSAGAAISIFVFATTIIVLTMFLLQIIREMMRDIGVMQALGIQKEHIMILLSLFSLIMAVIGTAFGVFFGHLLELGLDKIVGGVFGIASKAPPVRWGTSALSFALVIVASQFATLFASFRITKLTPVDALNDQASSKKVLPPSIDKKLQHSSPGVRLTVNSIVTKPKRFVTSFLAIFSTTIIIFTAIASLASFKTALNNLFTKYIRYDAQVIFAGEVPADFEKEELEKKIGVKKNNYEKTGYGTITISYKGIDANASIQGIQSNSKMVYLPTKGNDHTPLPEKGITVNMITAKNLGLKGGEYVTINGKKVKVAYITQFEAYDACFCKQEDVALYSNNAVDSYLIKGVSKEKLLRNMTNYHFDSMVTFTDDQKSYFMSRFKVLEMCCYVFIGFAVGLGMIIVSLMMQTSLQEQRRDLCIMRSVGFSMGQISGIWSFVTILQYIFACAFAVPLSFLVTKILLGFTATKMAMVLSYANWIHALITLFIVAAFLVLSQAICMRKVKKWNIADNTKNRE